MKNHEVYRKNPLKFELLNNGVSKVAELAGDEALTSTLRFELENFVCDGEYGKGLERILDAYLAGLNKSEQQAAWVSGFFGSGKSHLVKMLRYLWVDHKFPDGATARSIVNLPTGVKDRLIELSNRAKQYGGLQAMAGTLGAGAMDNVRLAFLQLIFRAAGLPENIAGARFVLWLKQQKYWDPVMAHLTSGKHDPEKEIRNFQVSPKLAEAILTTAPAFGDVKGVQAAIRAQFPNTNNTPTIDETLSLIKTIYSDGSSIPCTLLVVDEVQQYIGDHVQRAMDVQEIAESCCTSLDRRLLLVCTGQSALTGTASLSRLQARFTVKISLTDTDVETVIRQTVLAKRPEKEKQIREIVEANMGEISRQLQSTRLATVASDAEWYAADYPLLPVRRRFWEKVLRNVDESGTIAQLRSQLGIVFDAARATADQNLGHVVAGDFIYNEKSSELLNNGILPKEYHETIVGLRSHGATGVLKSRLCALMFLISRLSRTAGSDDGVRATADTLADLLVEDLKSDGGTLRAAIPQALEELVNAGTVMLIDNEYHLQTREGANWNHDFNGRCSRIKNDDSRLSVKREELLSKALDDALKPLSLNQGVSRQPRDMDTIISEARPVETSNKLTFWVRHGWSESENTVLKDARTAGNASAMLYGYLPRIGHDELKQHIAVLLAAQETIDGHGTPSTTEAIQACDAMKTRLQTAEVGIKSCLRQVLADAKVFLGGGSRAEGLQLVDMVRGASEDALHRLFPKFTEADFSTWGQVLSQARGGNVGALDAVQYHGETVRHPVCKQIFEYIGAGKKGREVREYFRSAPFGWPQDAIDASLVILTLAGNLRASINGQPVTAKDLNQTQIGNAGFSVDIPPLSTDQRLALKALFQKLGVQTAAAQESVAAAAFLTAWGDLVNKAGDEPPAPVKPSVQAMRELQSLSGNGQLLALYQKRDEITATIDAMKKASVSIAKRSPRWKRLEELVGMGESLPAAETVKVSMAAIVEARNLLAEPDPVPPLIQTITASLRDTLSAVHADHKKVFTREQGKLDSNPSWKKLTVEQRTELLSRFNLAPLAPISVGTEDEIYDTLKSQSLSGRKTVIEALPHRFAGAAEEAARILTPKAVRIPLPSTTVTTEKELDVWIAEVRDLAVEQLKQGPVIL